MIAKAIAGLFRVILIALVLCPCALALDGNAGSCLIFPYFNSHPDTISVFRISNVSKGEVSVRLVVIDEETCTPWDRWVHLTANDTVTFLDSWMTPNPMRGFMYANVVEGTGTAEEMNVLIGQEIVFDSWSLDPMMSFSINALAFEAIDVEPDGDIHLDGSEYGAAPKAIHLPGFFGEEYPDAGNSATDSRLVFVNLTGGKHFVHTAKLLIYNDNEQAFSAQHSFPCFAFVRLKDVSGATRNSFLLSTDHDLDEPLGFADWDLETGWIAITGGHAVNPNSGHGISNASLIAVLVERIGPLTWFASLPFHLEDPSTHDTAMLWSTSPSGN
ncbi:MAG: hypothetical protein ACYTG7_08650 [Planctomycetota bacterium]|jgi:hypothetical protein